MLLSKYDSSLNYCEDCIIRVAKYCGDANKDISIAGSIGGYGARGEDADLLLH